MWTRSGGRAAAGLVLLALAPTSLRVHGAPDGEDRYEVSGFVVDADDRPAPGVWISLEGTDVAAESDSLGGFVLRDIPKGTYRLTARLGCVMSGHLDVLHVPRPLRVPLPIRLVEVDCYSEVDLSPPDQSDMIGRSIIAFARADRQAIVTALFADRAIRLLDGGNASVDEVPVEDVGVHVEHFAQDTTFDEAIWISICLTTPNDRTALVRLVRSSPPVPEELDVFAGDAALFTFARDGADRPWHLARHLICVDAAPVAGSNGVPGPSAP
jgi:hypothetical protein